LFLDNGGKQRRGSYYYLIIGALLIIGSASFAYSLVQQREVPNNEDPPKATMAAVPTPEPLGDNTAQVVVPQQQLADGAKVIVSYYHTPCGHGYDLPLNDASLIGMGKNDLILRYPQMELLEFSSEGAKLKCTLTAYCPEHYLLKLSEDGKLSIYQTEKGTNDLALIRELSIDTTLLNTDDFTSGMVFDDMESIESYLENLES